MATIKEICREYKHWIIFLIVFLFVVFSLVLLAQTGCMQYETQCFKTECNFWGCGQIRVDLDSQQCEIKKEVCVNGFG